MSTEHSDLVNVAVSGKMLRHQMLTMSQSCSHGRKSSPASSGRHCHLRAAHPYWKQEKREREIKEAKEAEERARRATEAERQADQQPTDAAACWQQHDQRVFQCIKLWIEQWYPPQRDALTKAVGEVFGDHRASVHETITNLKERIIRLEAASNFEKRFNSRQRGQAGIRDSTLRAAGQDRGSTAPGR
ncbi:MAG TPA: hypothetical protein VGJ20_44100 [Xanthobacteraceae bacterium]